MKTPDERQGEGGGGSEDLILKAQESPGTPHGEAAREAATGAPSEAHPAHAENEAELSAKLSPEVREALEGLRSRHGKEIVARLRKDERLSAQFLADPVGALRAMRIEVPDSLRRLGKPRVALDRALQPRSFRLPGGQVITPKVRIRFTEGDEG